MYKNKNNITIIVSELHITEMFIKLINEFRLKLSQSLINELINAFAGVRRNVIDQGLLKSVYMKHFPNTKLPPEKPDKKRKINGPNKKKEKKTETKEKIQL